jgi:signal transduction histidine kinase
MSTPHSNMDLGRQLAARLAPLALAIALLIAVVPPAIYLVIESGALHRTATLYARELCERLNVIVLAGPTLWKFGIQKHQEILNDFIPYKNVFAVHVVDESGRPITGLEYGGEAAHGAWWTRLAITGSAPIVFNNRVMGTVHVEMSRWPTLVGTLTLLLVSAVTGTGLATLVYRFPVAVVVKMEGRIEELIDSVERANTELDGRVREAETLLELTRATSSTLDAPELFAMLAAGAARACGVDRCTIFLADGSRQSLIPVRSQLADGLVDSRIGNFFKTLAKLKVGGFPLKAQEGFLEGQPLVVPDAAADTVLPHGLAELAEIKSFMIVPFTRQGIVVGVLLLDHVVARHDFSAGQVRMAMTIAGQAGLALENAHLFAEAGSQATTLKARNAELDSFVYSVSHDLKAPLVTIQGMAGVLVEDFAPHLPPEGRHYVERIQANAQQMERLILDLLALSRIGREAHASEPIHLAELIDEVVAGFAEPISGRGIKVSQRDLGTLWGIRIQLEQVFNNLVGNAIKYLGDTPSPAIEIGSVERGAVVECYVSDNGIGIDPAYHDKVFEIFQRLKEVEASGTGVGLAIVKKIVEGAGGRIWVESAPGQGATFRFTWPKPPREERS